LGEDEEMSEASAINEGSAGPPEKPVFNPKQKPSISKEYIIEQAKKLWDKIVYLLGAGMKRNVILQRPDGKEVGRLPLTLTLLIVLLSQFILLIIAAVLVAFFKWKVTLEGPKPPVQTPPPPPSLLASSPPVAEPESGYSEPTLPPMPT
jgi:hypothetical protein